MGLLDIFTIIFEADTKKASADIEKFNGDAAKGAEKTKKEAEASVKAIEKQIKAIEEQAAVAGKSAKEATLYKLAQSGATKADLDRARAALNVTENIEKQSKATELTTKKIFALAAAVFASGKALGALLSKVDEIAEIDRMSESFGLAVEDVDAFGRAAIAAGGDAKGARDSIVDMAETIGEALQDVESNRAKILHKLGIDLRDINGGAISATEGLLSLAGAVEGMSREEATFNVKQLGITDNKTVEILLKGRAELERMLKVQKDQGVVTKEQVAQAQKFTESMNAFKGSLNSAGTSITSALIPALSAVIDWLTKAVIFLSDHKDFVIGFFLAVSTIVTAIYLPAMLAAATATLAATWPLLAIIAAITAVGVAFALVYDDIMNFIDGNDSLIGLMIDKVSQFIEFVAGIPEAIAGSLEAVGDLFSAMGDGIMAVWDFIAAGIRAYIDFIMAGVAKISEGIGAVASFFGLGDSDTAASVESGQQAVAVANASPLNSVTSNSISNSVASSKRENNIQIGELTVQTQATDAGGVARGVSGELGAQLAQMDAEFSSGVAR